MASSGQPLLKELGKRLGLEQAKLEVLEANYNTWQKSLGPFRDELKRSEAVSEEDLVIRINVRDYD